MEKYLVLCDLDDTLLTNEKEITADSVDFIRKFKDLDNLFCIATGRPYQGAYKYYEILGKDAPYICDNGCSIYFKNEPTIFFGIDLEIFKEIINQIIGMDQCIFVVTGNKTTYSHNYDLVPDFLKHNELNDIKNIENDFDSGEYIPLICNLYLKEEYYDNCLNILNNYKKYIQYTYWGNNDHICAFEIRSINGSKGNALKYLKNKYDIKDDHTIAFGDQLNDIDILKEAFYGVSMINANEEVKKETKYTTDLDFNNNGVIDFIKKHKLY